MKPTDSREATAAFKEVKPFQDCKTKLILKTRKPPSEIFWRFCLTFNNENLFMSSEAKSNKALPNSRRVPHSSLLSPCFLFTDFHVLRSGQPPAGFLSG